ncbi:unnamed protein product [Symbiodinium natans]|uniref:Resolvase/invertase-type recombinase catalytic domain-containing protein n=1 Tax=Symbiodinium natans TaxID=878477 RepID=A0A812LHQ4_9DINO|nr:unnamed protein product [Symbiodinium natans]CAE7289769.1 unnamed protein product [Symbiodinium natans]
MASKPAANKKKKLTASKHSKQTRQDNNIVESKKKAAVYSRTSSKTNISGDSTGRQMRAGLAAAKSSGCTPVSLKRVSECISGMLPLPQRKKLHALLDGSYSHVYVESLRALGRKASGIEEVYEAAKKTKTNVVVADLPCVFSLSATPAEAFQRRVMAAVQEFERDVIVNRLQEGLEAKAKKLKSQGKDEKVNGRKSYLDKFLKKEGENKTMKMKALKALCMDRQKGKFGFRELAVKASKVLALKKSTIGKDAAVTLSQQLGIH